MRYLITLKPLEPFLFGGDNTFGDLGDKMMGSYLVQSRYYPQQTTLLGMLQKEIMLQAGLLTRKRKGEWADDQTAVKELIGTGKLSIGIPDALESKAIEKIEPVFLRQGDNYYIKKADIDSHPYDISTETLRDYDPKKDIFDNYRCIQTGRSLRAEDIFEPVVQTGNKKGGADDSLFKKTSYLLKDGFVFSFFIETTFELKGSIVHLGADRGAFKMTVQDAQDNRLDHMDDNGYLVLLSDSYVEAPLDDCCAYAVTSELSFRHLKNKKNKFSKSETYYFYEKGSVFIKPTDTLIEQLNSPYLQDIGYNTFTQGENR